MLKSESAGGVLTALPVLKEHSVPFTSPGKA